MPQVISPSGIPIAYEVHGTGTPALVFVHGWSCDRGYWKGQLESFSKRFTVVAVDLGGHGESGDQRSAWTIREFGTDVAAVIETLRLNQTILIGHSMGGDVIVEAARMLRNGVLGLVWVDVYQKLGQPRSPEDVQTFVASIVADFVKETQSLVRTMFSPSADSALVEFIAEDMSAAPSRVALPALESALSFDREIPSALAKLGLPVIAINPDYAPTDADSLGRHGIDVMIMPGVGHFLMLEDPKGFNPLLDTAIAKLVTQSPSR